MGVYATVKEILAGRACVYFPEVRRSGKAWDLAVKILRTRLPSEWVVIDHDEDYDYDYLLVMRNRHQWVNQQLVPAHAENLLHVVNVPVHNPVEFIRMFRTIHGEVCWSNIVDMHHHQRGEFFSVVMHGSPVHSSATDIGVQLPGRELHAAKHGWPLQSPSSSASSQIKPNGLTN
jgi:hypothetical protein